MALVFSLIVLGLSLYLFVMTSLKLSGIKDQAVTDVQKEMQALLSEFNRTAVRNIEILEDKINELQKVMEKADHRILQLDSRIARSEKPIVIEKIVHQKAAPEKPKKKTTRKPKATPKPATKTSASQAKVAQTPPSSEKKSLSPSKIKLPSPEPKKQESRGDTLKRLITEDTPLKKLLSMGFHENEINLVRFLIKRGK